MITPILLFSQPHSFLLNVRFWHKADIQISTLMAPFGSPALPGRQALLR